MRIFGLGSEILRRHRSSLDQMNRRSDAIQLKNAFSIATSWLIFGMGFIGAIVFVVERVLQHQATSSNRICFNTCPCNRCNHDAA